MNSTDIIGWMLGSDIYHAQCLVKVLPTGEGEQFDGWALAAGAAPMSADDNLHEIASAFGDDAPVPVFVAGGENLDDVCSACTGPLEDGPYALLQVKAQHVDSTVAYVEVGRAASEGDVVSDAVAVTVASWWASSGTGGRALAALSTGARTTVEAVQAEVELLRMVGVDGDWRDLQAADALATWLDARA